ncbi:MAG: alanine/glycine:cation symporter family protein [Bacillota bacterium]
MFTIFFDALSWLANQLWGLPMMILLLGTGTYFTVTTKFFQFRKIGYILKNTFGKIFEKEKEGVVGVMTPFQAVSTALAGTVGTGNIAGVAAAISVGGPGAVFWMWVVALVGMITKMVEVSLAVHFREVNEDGSTYGGPMYYIEKGLGKNWKWLSNIFAFTVVIAGLTTAALLQPHTVGEALNTTFNIPPIATAIALSILTGIVIIGGFKRIGKISEKLVPFMALLYAITGLIIIFMNITEIPSAFGTIFKYAFSPAPIQGGFLGATIAITIQKGMSRGMFSNEAGMGSAPMVHATAKTDSAIRQGLWGSFEVFVDTIIICTITALVIIVTGSWTSGLSGIELTINAFNNSIFGSYGGLLVTFASVLFAYSTMIGWYVNYETGCAYVFGGKSVKYMKWLYLVPGIIFAGQKVNSIWLFADLSSGLMGIPNLIALIMLSGVFMKLFKEFMENEGKIENRKNG